MKSKRMNLSMIYVLLAVFALAVFSATPASASKLSTWLLGGASAYEFSQGNDTAGAVLGLGALYTWQQDRAASQRAQAYYYSQPYGYYPQTYYYYPQPRVYYYPQTRVYYYPRSYAYGRYGY
jgi:hypothetical protein